MGNKKVDNGEDNNVGDEEEEIILKVARNIMGNSRKIGRTNIVQIIEMWIHNSVMCIHRL